MLRRSHRKIASVCEAIIRNHLRLSASVIGLALCCALGVAASYADQSVGVAESSATAPCPTVSLAPEVKIVELASAGRGADGGDPILRPYSDPGCSDLCDAPTVSKSFKIDDPGDVFLVLVGSYEMLWKPVAGDRTRIVGVLILNAAAAKLYTAGGILGAAQFSPVSNLPLKEFALACKLADVRARVAEDVLRLSEQAWIKEAVQAVTGRGPDRVQRD